MKRVQFLHFSTLMIFLSAVIFLSSCYTPPWFDNVYTGEETPLLEGTMWSLSGYSSAGALIFRPGGRFTFERSSTYGTWERKDNKVTFILHGDGGKRRVLYEGVFYPQNQTIVGTRIDDASNRRDFSMQPFSEIIIRQQ